MEANFWHKMWQSGVVGFHQPKTNAFLETYWPKLALSGSEEVLVPLCGKSVDMLWLNAVGHDVLGVELSEKAVNEFLTENETTQEFTRKDIEHAHYRGFSLTNNTADSTSNVSVLCGDFFKLAKDDVKQVGAVYDRAALVALPPEMRADYAKHLIRILPEKVKILQITMEYDQSKLPGPPFSVPETELRGLYENDFKVTLVHTSELDRKGVSACEKIYVLERG